MALASNRRRRAGRTDYWPGFVDAMATLLLVIIFLLSFFMLAQFFLSQEISGRDTVLNRLNQQIAELTELLALERSTGDSLEDQIASLTASLADVESERDALEARVGGDSDALAQAENQLGALGDELDDERRISERARNQIDLLNQQISALRRQIASLEAALGVAETREEESQARIADLGRRLNVALAERVQELSRYRSDFFGRLREILSERSDIRVVGDRFVFQSEVLFAVGAAAINEDGEEELERLAEAILELEEEIPEEIEWVLRVDGHTDAQPLSGFGEFEDNWELSAARAISVVKFLVDEGVDPQHLVAAGFGEFQPLEEGDMPEVYARNRRIELKLTEQ